MALADIVQSGGESQVEFAEYINFEDCGRSIEITASGAVGPLGTPESGGSARAGTKKHYFRRWSLLDNAEGFSKILSVVILPSGFRHPGPQMRLKRATPSRLNR